MAQLHVLQRPRVGGAREIDELPVGGERHAEPGALRKAPRSVEPALIGQLIGPAATTPGAC
jgi:hypothetical protein